MERTLSGETHACCLPSGLSVVINNYNYADYLAQAVDSVLAQLRPGDELVVVDDGSSDASGAVLARYRGHAGVRIIEQTNQGQLAAVFNGLAASRGELCLLLDSDDWFLPGYLSRMRRLSEAYPGVEMFFSAPLTGGGSVAAATTMQSLMAARALPEGETGITRWSTWISGEFVGTPTSGLALRRSLVERFLAVRDQLPDFLPAGQRPSRFLISRDRHTAFRLSADGIIVRGSSIAGARKYYCPEPGFFYRIHGSNAFATLGRISLLYLRFYRGRQISRIVSSAFAMEAPPAVDEVVAEARQRSRPLRWRRRLLLALNYQMAALSAVGPLSRRLAAQPAVLRHFLSPAQRPSQSPGRTQQ